MRNLILSMFLFIGCVPAFGQNSSVEICIEFRVGIGTVDTAYGNNAVRLLEVISHLDEIRNDSTLELVEVSFCGAASPEGRFRLNEQLAADRLASLERYVRERVFIPDSIITRCNGAIAWKLLAGLVESSDMLHKEETLHVLRNVPEYTYEGGKLVDSRKKQLMMLQYGRTWHFLKEHYFRQMRNACAIFLTVRNKPLLPVVEEAEKEEDLPVTGPVDSAIVLQTPDSFSVAVRNSSFCMSLKTNMLYDLLAVPNIGIEFYLGKNWSIAANWMYAWWKTDKHHRYWRTYGGDIAVRKWFGRKAGEKTLSGHHLGLYGQMLTYDFEWEGKGDLGDRWSYAGGVEYGYSLPVARRLNIDFTLGVGYLGGEYKKYVPRDGHYVWKATKDRHWFGPTKAEVSLVWLLGPGCNNSKKGGTK